MRKCLFLLLLLCNLLIFAGAFEDGNKLFADANKFSLENPQKAADLYKQALLKYQFALKTAETGAVHYNLGNCHFRLGDNGNAIFHYKKALQLDPLNKDVSHNLHYVRTLNDDEFEKSQLHQIFTAIIVWSKLPIYFQFSVVFVALIIFFYIKGHRLYNADKKYQNLANGAIFVGILFITSSVLAINDLTETSDGVIIAKEVTARHGDGLIYEPAFSTKLHNGTEFELLETRGDWLHIELPDNSKCWIQSNKVLLF